MQTESTHPRGLFGRLQARLRGDRYMVNAYPDPAAEPEPAVVPAPPVPVPPATPAG